MFLLELKDTHGEVVNITKHAHQQRTITLQKGHNKIRQLQFGVHVGLGLLDHGLHTLFVK